MQLVIKRTTTEAVVDDEQAQVASFIGSHLQELASLAQRAGLDTLEMAALEAKTVAADGHASDLDADFFGR
jgi:hypothetical protein